MVTFHPRIRYSAACVAAGGVVAYPTEAVWGLGCDPFDEVAVARILRLKKRPKEKGLILIASSIQQVMPFLTGLSAGHIDTLTASWPGPNTWLVPNNGLAPDWITGGKPTLAVRVTDHPIARALCHEYAGPLVSTSANPSSMPEAKTALKVHCYFRNQLDDVLPGRIGSSARPTAIRDLLSGATIRA